MLPEVLPTVDPELGALVHAELDRHGVDGPHRHHRHRASPRAAGTGRLHVDGPDRTARPLGRDVDLVLVVVGVRPDTDLLAAAGATPRRPRAPSSSTSTWHRPARTCAPPATASSPTTACSASPTCRSAPPRTSKAGSPARTPSAATPASPAASAPRSSRSSTSSPPAPGCATTKPRAAGYDAAHQPGQPRRPQGVLPRRHPITIRVTGDRNTGRCSAPSSSGRGTETAKRVDTYATALPTA